MNKNLSSFCDRLTQLTVRYPEEMNPDSAIDINWYIKRIEESAVEKIEELNVAPWQIDLLKLNSEYCDWGPGSEYMCDTDSNSWDTSKIYKTWEEFGPWELDDLNEVVNFYFSANRLNKPCTSCDGTGLAPEAKLLNDSWHRTADGLAGWKYHLEQSDVNALWDAQVFNRYYDEKPSAEAVNKKMFEEANKLPAERALRLYQTDCDVCVKAKSERLGIEHDCPYCDGKGYIFTTDHAYVSLILWILHPRKSCSRGVEITNIEEKDLPAILAYLGTAAIRSERRFQEIPR